MSVTTWNQKEAGLSMAAKPLDLESGYLRLRPRLFELDRLPTRLVRLCDIFGSRLEAQEQNRDGARLTFIIEYCYTCQGPALCGT